MNAEVETLKTQLGELLQYDKERLVRRPEWGKITLEAAEDSINDLFVLCEELKNMPIQLIPTHALQALDAHVTNAINLFREIDGFDIEKGTPKETADQFQTRVKRIRDEVITTAAPWMGFLAYKMGGMQQRLADIDNSAQNLMQKLTATINEAHEGSTEVQKVLKAAREAAASAGAAVFTDDFERSAGECGDFARRWLWGTAGFAVATLLAAFLFWYWTEAGLDNAQILQKVSTKILALALLFSGTVWCGRNYKALKHLQAVNKHRAVSIKTLQAFSAAAHDPEAKNAVLIEAARAVYGNVPTGYVESTSGSEGDVRVLEVFRGLIPKQ